MPDFSRARFHLFDDYKTVTGLEIPGDYSGWYELYCHGFSAALEAGGCQSDDAYACLLERMTKYRSVGDFLTFGPQSQQVEMAAFGLLLFERLLQAEAEGVSHSDAFHLHEQLVECYQYISAGTERRELARHAAGVRHVENRAMKAQAFAWLDDNFSGYGSMDSAAEAIAGKQLPVKFRTARDWVGEWAKARRSASRA